MNGNEITVFIISRMLSRIFFRFSKVKVPKVGQIEKYWDNYSSQYSSFDLAPQTFYYSFLNLTSVWEASNILQVACGTGKILPLAIQLKQKSAHYTATDLSPNMISLAKQNLRANFQKYASKVSFEEWLRNHNFHFTSANAEEPISSPVEKKFDRIYCNLALMITQNADKMLKSLADSAEKGCLLGVSVWGDKSKNSFMTAVRQSYLESGLDLPQQRSNFHLHGKVGGLAEKCGWQVVMSWQQNVLFPIIEVDEEKHGGLLFHQVQKLPAEHQPGLKKLLMGKVHKLIDEKKGLNFTCDLYVLRKI